jgi:hypothetical protein
MNRAIDLIASYLNSAQSVFAAFQRLKNELHTESFDLAHLLKLLTKHKGEPSTLGQQKYLSAAEWEELLLAALAAFVVYASPTSDNIPWTDAITQVLDAYAPSLQGNSNELWLEQVGLAPKPIDLLQGHHMSTSKATAFIGIYKPTGKIVLTLPGTNSKQDWLSNLHSSPTDLELHPRNDQTHSIKVHSGFLAIARTLYSHPHIRDYLLKATSAGYSDLLLAGHSQAGACMSLLGLLYVYSPISATRKSQNRAHAPLQFRNVNVYTFGSGAWCSQSSEAQLKSLQGVDIQSFVRCKRELNTWRVDPVPFVDESLLDTPKSGSHAQHSSRSSMLPGGDLSLLLDRISEHAPGHIRIVNSAELRTLSSVVWLNMDTSAHSMAGYVAQLLRQCPAASHAQPNEQLKKKAMKRLEMATQAEQEPQASIALLMEASGGQELHALSSDGNDSDSVSDATNSSGSHIDEQVEQHQMVTRSKRRKLN